MARPAGLDYDAYRSAASAEYPNRGAAGYPSSAREDASAFSRGYAVHGSSERSGAGGHSYFPLAKLAATDKFAALGQPKRIWVIGSIHGDVYRLQSLHDEMAGLFAAGDRLVYLGNFLGIGQNIIETINELLDFRRAMIATPGVLASDIVYLRGGQEEMWSKLQQIQFSPSPLETYMWMMKQGAEATLRAYRIDPQQGLAAARDSVMSMTRWTTMLRAEVRSHPGHEQLYNALRRAAFSGGERDEQATAALPAGRHAHPSALLLVNSGLDVNKPLANQGDNFWWGASSWGMICRPYGQFAKVIRGYDPTHGGACMTTHTLTIDGGCGYGGPLLGACLTPTGEVIDIIEV